jgi:Dolichyl-phosphate-mannose-protein mannosyltransferase
MKRLANPAACARAAAAALTLLAVIRVVASYRDTAQGFDEPCHVAAGMEWLAKGTYTLDPVHPPLSRDAIALPLYLAGERYPQLPLDDPSSKNYNVVGNAILYGDGHYLRNLDLARCGMLPFLLLAVAIVFFWTRTFGDLAAVMAVALLTTVPIVLAFSGLAYSDMAAGSTQAACLFAFTVWLDRPTRKATVWLGIAAGLAFLAKLTSLLFLPAAAAAIALTRRMFGARGLRRSAGDAEPKRLPRFVAAAVLTVFVFWAGYGFSVGHVQEDMQLSPSAMPSFQHFPPIVGNLARQMVTRDALVPVPAFLRGVADAWVLNKSGSLSYLLGRTKPGGWWYFFLVGVAVKTPLPFLLLSLIGVGSVLMSPPEAKWKALAPIAAVAAIFVVTMPVKYDAGMRHVLVLFPLLAVVAGAGCSFLWQRRGRWSAAWRAVLIALLVWQGATTIKASSDYIAYFNELAGHDPSKVLLTGCDLDCGQDLFRLARELKKRNISDINIAMWSSADISQAGLPQFEVLQPFHPVTGWVAVSLRSLRLGDVFHKTYPPGAFAWLSAYHPVGPVGKTIWLYYIPAPEGSSITRNQGSSGSESSKILTSHLLY